MRHLWREGTHTIEFFYSFWNDKHCERVFSISTYNEEAIGHRSGPIGCGDIRTTKGSFCCRRSKILQFFHSKFEPNSFLQTGLFDRLRQGLFSAFSELDIMKNENVQKTMVRFDEEMHFVHAHWTFTTTAFPQLFHHSL
jgi:hypothetical protein